ncbi:MAG: putative lipid II flippase FtsW [Propionibacteriaceae bacterium]
MAANSSSGSAKQSRGLSIRELALRILEAPLADFYLIVGSAALLVLYGILVVISSSSVTGTVEYSDPYFFAKKQLIFLLLGIPSSWWLSRCKFSTLRWLSWVMLFLSGLLLVATFLPGIGMEVMGNRNWIRIGPLSLQPSEFAKIAIITWGADLLHRKQKLLDQPKHLLTPFLPVSLLLVALVLLEKDLGTAMIMILLILAVLWVVGTPWRVLLAMLGVSGAFVGILVLTNTNRMRRILGFAKPDTNVTGINMQPLQGVYAVASGGWWGRGIGKSRSKYGLLTQSHTDYAFAILSEELGVFGSLTVVGLFGILGWAAIRVSRRSDLLYARITSFGIATWFLVQATINIAVVLRLLPVVGVPLPFISYGGSALLANLVALGFLLGCARQEPAARRVLSARAKGKNPRLSTVVSAGRK